MLTHSQIWSAIDALARRQNLTPSGLAKRAGLDATTFNRSKRQNVEGQPRWPSTESIAKVLAATGVAIDDFLALIDKDGHGRALPFRLARDLDRFAFDDQGLATGSGWDPLAVLGDEVSGAFAIGLSGDADAPFFRDGDILIASAVAPRRRGDRVVVIHQDGAVTLAELGHETARQLQLRALDGTELPARKMSDIRLLARILWVSQ